jgi:NodT family efflux transporter outer membrane factor (OMF) lipoprotein
MRGRTERFSERAGRWAALAVLLALSGCSVGPKYQTPTVQTPSAYKEPTAQTVYEPEPWKVAQPSDAVIPGKWWETFGDADLNALEEKINISNQNVASAAASFLAARALVKQARAQYYPTVAAAPSIADARPSPAQFGGIKASGGSSSSGSTFTVGSFASYSLPFDATWQPDFWGRIRNTIDANVLAAQGSAADLENVRLTMQAEVAVDYFELRAQDALKQLFDQTVAGYRDSLDLTQIQLRAGIASDEAVEQAATQLQTTQAADTDLGIVRAQYEHALAALVGQPAPAFAIPILPINTNPPSVPFAVPAQLLERRPDVAEQERLVAAANARIGVARAAYYPNVTLSATAGLGSTSIVDWFTWPSRFWSVGPQLSETLFDAGLRKSTLQQSQALYDQSVANYRQTVLTAFQQVEDNLAALRILSTEIQQQNAAIDSAQKNLQVANDRYRAGIDPYLNVITAQTTLLSTQQTAVGLRREQMTATVQLIEALGGGWDASQLPKPKELGAGADPRAGVNP